ncbi:MAG: D-alanyl-D-alanine carboxypeptidase family protein [Porcipelethomonas sp.]
MSRKKRVNVSHVVYVFMGLFIVVLFIMGIHFIMNPEKISSSAVLNSEAVTVEFEIPTEEETYPTVEYPDADDEVKEFDDKIVSKYAVLLDVDENKVLAERKADEIIYPASMTKIMTLIVAVENMGSLDDTFTMTYDILSPLVYEDASRAGFEEGETITVEDMLYGAVLPSGADATIGLAECICGSEESFVELMNEKAKSMGLKNTHFTNTSGLHNDDHYSTATEIAMILEYAMQNELCRKILSTYQYTTSKTKEHPEGIPLESTMFSRMYGDEVEGVLIEGGKTGYTDEAENCLASFAVKDGHEYVAVTTGSYSHWLTIYDAFEIYESYIE